jgi:hypothetical protein
MNIRLTARTSNDATNSKDVVTYIVAPDKATRQEIDAIGLKTLPSMKLETLALWWWEKV